MAIRRKLTAEMTWAKPVTCDVRGKKSLDKKVAVFASRPLNCSACADKGENMITANEKIKEEFEKYWSSVEKNDFSHLTNIGIRNLVRDAFTDAFEAGLAFEMLRQKESKRISVLDSEFIS